MQPSANVGPDEAAQTLARVRAVREETDRRLTENWFPLVVIGLLLCLSSPWLFYVWHGGALALFWLVVTPVVIAAIRSDRRRQLRAMGAVRDARPYLLIAATFIAACAACGAISGLLADPAYVAYGPLLALAGVHAYIAARSHSAAFAAWAVAIVAATVLVALIDAETAAAQGLAVGIGGNLALEGFKARRRAAA